MKATIPCPFPGTCEFDDFRRSGNHLCLRVVCPYTLCPDALRRAQAEYLESLPPERRVQAPESG